MACNWFRFKDAIHYFYRPIQQIGYQRVNEELKHALKMGDGVAVFAESRISCGKDVQPFRSALLSAPVECNMPVHYASITYENIDGTPLQLFCFLVAA